MEANLLFLHQNFPGQYKLLSTEFARRPTVRVVALGQGQRSAGELSGIDYRKYTDQPDVAPSNYPPLTFFSEQVRKGNAVRLQLLDLRRKGFVPDVVFVHPGWGEAVFLRDIYPDVKLVSYLEFYYRSHDSDLDFDPEFRAPPTDLDFVSLRNLPTLQAAAVSHRLISPTNWQADLFPAPLTDNIQVIHEGVDTSVAAPGPARAITTPSGRVIDAGRPTVTYVSRSLEPYRGFHTFMRALPQILRQNPTVEVMIVGKDEVSYGRPPGEGGSWREVMLREVGRDLDLSRVHFLGTLPYAELINLFRLSTVHVYLTYPFVLSWSLLEAMASGCAVVGSSTGPVMEVIEDGLNGVLTNFFDERELTAHVSGLLRDPQARQRLAAEARRTVAEKYDFRKVALPAYEQLIDTLIDE